MKTFIFVLAILANFFIIEFAYSASCNDSCPTGYFQSDDCQCNPPSYAFIGDAIKDKGAGGKGWIVTYNPERGQDFLFIHKRIENRMLTDLEYVVEVKGGDWVIYSGDSYNPSIGRASIGNSAPLTRISKPKGVSIGKCGC